MIVSYCSCWYNSLGVLAGVHDGVEHPIATRSECGGGERMDVYGRAGFVCGGQECGKWLKECV